MNGWVKEGSMIERSEEGGADESSYGGCGGERMKEGLMGGGGDDV